MTVSSFVALAGAGGSLAREFVKALLVVFFVRLMPITSFVCNSVWPTVSALRSALLAGAICKRPELPFAPSNAARPVKRPVEKRFGELKPLGFDRRTGHLLKRLDRKG